MKNKKEYKIEKLIAIAVCSAIMGSIIWGCYHASIDGNYFAISFGAGIFLLLGLILALYGYIKLVNWIWKFSPVLILAIAMQGCSYAKSNQQVLVSTDCGMTWQKINAGDAVPKGTMNACYMKVVIPNFPMQGDSKFIANLKDRVRASVHIDYDYSITDPLAFIKQAKYLGKANADADDNSALNPDAFEGAENMVIDKRIRDVSKGMFLNQDIVELDQADLENDLMESANKILEPFGVHLNFIALTFDLDDQTRQAIDVSTAMKIYRSKEMEEIGKVVMSARAGAPKIIIEIPSQEVKQQ